MMSTRSPAPVSVRGAAPLVAEMAGGMAIVDHDESAIALGKVADRRKIGDDAVHGKDAVGGDQFEARAITVGGLELIFERIHVAVGKAVALGLAKPDAVNDRGVVETVGDNRVVGPEQRFEQAPLASKQAANKMASSLPRYAAIRCSNCRCRVCVPQMKRTEAMPKPNASSAFLAAAMISG